MCAFCEWKTIRILRFKTRKKEKERELIKQRPEREQSHERKTDETINVLTILARMTAVSLGGLSQIMLQYFSNEQMISQIGFLL